MNDCTVVPPYPPFHFPGFSYLRSTAVQKQMILLLTDRQKVSSSPTLSHNACVTHLTSSHHIDILSSHITRRRVSSQYFERDHIHITFIMVYYNCYILLLVIKWMDLKVILFQHLIQRCENSLIQFQKLSIISSFMDKWSYIPLNNKQC